jgi:hypothetical protein
MSKELDVHEYDGKLKYYHELKKIDNDNLINLNYDECMEEIKELSPKILSRKELKNFNIVYDTVCKKNNSNFDSSNVIDFEDLLPRVWKFYRHTYDNEKYIFFEQFADISGGLCPQGRSGGRLIQLYKIWIFYLVEYLDNKMNNLHIDTIKILESLLKNKDTKLEDTKLEDTKLEDTKLEDTKLEDTKLEDTKLEDTKLEDTKQKHSTTILTNTYLISIKARHNK